MKNIFDFQLNEFFQEDLLSVWNQTATDTNCTTRIRDTLRRVLNLPPNTPMEYKSHNDSLKYIKTVTASTNANVPTTANLTGSSSVITSTTGMQTLSSRGLTPATRFISRQPFANSSHS